MLLCSAASCSLYQISIFVCESCTFRALHRSRARRRTTCGSESCSAHACTIPLEESGGSIARTGQHIGGFHQLTSWPGSCPRIDSVSTTWRHPLRRHSRGWPARGSHHPLRIHAWWHHPTRWHYPTGWHSGGWHSWKRPARGRHARRRSSRGRHARRWSAERWHARTRSAWRWHADRRRERPCRQ